MFTNCFGKSFSCSSNNSNTNDNTDKTEIKSVKVYFWHTFGQNIVTQLEDKIQSFEKIIKENEDFDVSIELKYQGGYSDILSIINKSFCCREYANNCSCLS